MISNNIKSLKIFVAYTSDCKAERDVIQKICNSDPTIVQLSRELGIKIDIFDWGQVFPNIGRPQSLINSDIKEFSPYWIVFLFWHRVGTDAGEGMSGIEEEWSLAKKLHEEGGGIPFITIYFNRDEPPVFQVDDEQRKALSKFRTSIFRQHEALASDFNQESKFEDLFRGHLSNRLLEHNKEGYSRQSTSLKNEFRIASKSLVDWPTNLPDGRWINREEILEVEQKIASNKSSTSLILGGPGSGKSALLAKLTKILVSKDIVVLAIKSDFISPEIKSSNELQESLGLSMPLISCLEAVAAISPVVLLIDQLDAVADLVDLHSERLNLLLDLINTVSERNNIHIVASCREFEQNHDPRLRNLNMDIIQLEPPDWETISEILTEYGYQTDGWPLDFKEVLRVPQNLQIFLDITSATDEYSTVLTYQSMLDRLWEKKVIKKKGTLIELVNDMSILMGDREELWLPIVRYQDQLSDIEYLEAEGILVRQNNGKKVGFRHQTLFEYSRARAFTSKEGSLSKFTLARQDALFVRPQVWNSLSYLRESDSYSYKQEFEGLWFKKNLRTHLKVLLIEYLGLLTQPEEYEVTWLLSELENKQYKRRIFSSVIGSQGWFLSLEKHYLPRYMGSTFEDSSYVMPILRVAWAFEADKVRNLLNTYWVPIPDKDKLTWDTLCGNEAWSKNDVDLASRILTRTSIDAWSVGLAMSELSSEQPKLAPKLFSSYLKRKLTVAKQEPDQEIPNLSDDAEISEIVAHNIKYNTTKKYESILEVESGFYDLPVIAEAAPKAFIDEVWDIFVDIINELDPKHHEYIVGYSDINGLSTELEDDRDFRRDHSLAKALEIAITTLSKQDSKAFFDFLSEKENINILVVQRILARGLKAIAEKYADKCLDFLISDSRRLILGTYNDKHLDSKALITEIVPYLSDTQLLSLEKLIFNWSMYKPQPGDDARTRFDRIKWNREHKLRLWNAFPKEYMSPGTRAHVGEEERAFPNLNDWDMNYTGVTSIGSHVSHEQMKKASDSQLLKLFSEINDSTGWDHPKFHNKGGIIQLSREFYELAKLEPQRVLGIIQQLKPGLNEFAVGHALEGIAHTDVTPDVLFEEIWKCVDRGFSSHQFRHDIANALEVIIDKSICLPDELITLLEKWLDSVPKSELEKKESDSDERDYDSSILWGYNRARSLPGGNYPVLRTISKACLMRKPPLTTKFQNIIYKHLDRDEDEKVWQCIIEPFFKYLIFDDSDGALNLLNRIFLKYPGVLYSVEGVMLIAQVQSRVSDNLLNNLFFQLRDSTDPFGEQGYGEILCIHYILNQDKQWVSELIHPIINIKKENIDRKKERILVGIGYSAANMCRYPEHRPLASDVLTKLIRIDIPQVYCACSDMFRVSKEFIPDEKTWGILDAISDFPPKIDNRSYNTSFLIELLEPLVPIVPDKVYKVCLGILKSLDDTDSERRDMSSVNGDGIVNISLAMQRAGGDYRKKGLELFERLLELDIYDARQALLELDRRPLVAEVPTRRRRRRRRK